MSNTTDKYADIVDAPSHYTYGTIECIDYIIDKDFDFALGNAIKYITRAGHKHEEGKDDTEKAVEDLMKAKKYIDFEIKKLWRTQSGQAERHG